MGKQQNLRGRAFESKVHALLTRLAESNSGFVEVQTQPEIILLNGQSKRPDFELIYRTDQENRELIECQSRDRSSSEIAEKIRQIKALSPRNRFIFVFEDLARLSFKHRTVLETDGVNCLSLDQFGQKLSQINSIVSLLKSIVPPGLMAILLELMQSGSLHRSAAWERALEYAADTNTGKGESTTPMLLPFRQSYHGPSSHRINEIDIIETKPRAA